MQTLGTNGMQAKNATGEQLSCQLKLEQPKLPKFTGDIREYAIFRSDWKHIVDTRYAKRDAITLLRANLSDKPLDYWTPFMGTHAMCLIASRKTSASLNRYKTEKTEDFAILCTL